jgi:Peptidase propeptide and YPEB domain
MNPQEEQNAMHGKLLLFSGFLLLMGASGIGKDRPVTDEERAKLVAAIAAEGCTGGKFEFDDDGRFEVDDVTCKDGRRYDLEFDTSFKLIKKDLDD